MHTISNMREAAPATLSEAELFREFIEADTIKKFDWQGKLRETLSIRYMLVEEGDEPGIGELIERELLYALHAGQSGDCLNFLADEFECIGRELLFVSRYFNELKAEREVRSGDYPGESRYRSLADVERDQVAGEAA